MTSSNVEWSDAAKSEDQNGANNLVISTTEGEASSSSTRLNLGLRKDLLTVEPTYLDIIVNEEDNDFFKNKPIFVEVEATDGDMLEQQQDRGPSYVNLTTLPTMIHDKKAIEIMANMSSNNNNNGMPSIATLFNSSWASSSAYEESNHNHFISPCHFQRNSMEMMSMQDFSNSSYIPTDDAFKSAMPLGPNPLYHLDTNNRRIWVPESSRGSSERDSSSGSRATAVALPDTGIYMVADLENDDMLNQHVVNIERFPNRCWRGPGSERSSSSRTQYEKGTI